ncbi:CatB-related O-acetyltransferase [Selenomonas ruminantium]|uniref:Transferase hexapeptide (Six repeat-containing protein) n=1 Tax=Selenomonas ruminantium TaxID=971 RepID=A0A1K1N9L2_SELRU|nr:CatB-related O-acetyltransferase [Selenomonas ruminantium]SFW32067.1 transferase hexapeptide (six repeat-containing protein) [Selenomonas ruminantium]
MDRDSKICQVLTEAVMGNRKNFILYPFGVNGVYVKLILNKRFGIKEKYILDNNLCKINPVIKSVEFLRELPKGSYTILLTSSNPDSYKQVLENLKKYADESDIIDIFRDYNINTRKIYTKCGKYSAGPLCNHWLVERVGAFSSFAEGCDVVLNHTVDFISTHGFLYADKDTTSVLPTSYSEQIGTDWYFPGVTPKKSAHKASRITIGNDVWLGKNVIITNGANIGDGVIAGAGAVITKDVPDYAIVGGVPARLIRWRYPHEQAKQLKAIAWWDWPDEKIRACYDDFYLPIEAFLAKHWRDKS